MVTKWKYIGVSVLLLVGLYSFGQKRHKQQAVKDIYGHPILCLCEEQKGVYHFEGGKDITAYIGGIEFKGGRD